MQERGDSGRGDLWFVVVLALLLSIPWLDRPFYSRGEPREALVAQSMVVTGNWISPPAYNGAVPSKPPFSHWLISLASTVVSDVSEVTSRLPSAIAFVLFTAGFYLFVLRRAGRESALLSCLILLSFSEWFRAGVSCRVDTILTTSLAGALLALYAWRERGHRGFPFLAAALISAAALTKGPIGVALPLAIFSFFELLCDEKSLRSVARITARGVMIGVPVIGIVSLWYIAGYLQRGDAFLEKIWYENFARLTSSMEDEPHKHSMWYLFEMLLIGVLPWTILWLQSFLSAVGGGAISKTSMGALWSRASALQRFAAVSALSVFLFFCIPSSKRSVYILPAYPFIALVAAAALPQWESRSRRTMVNLSNVILWFACLLCVLALVVIVVPFREELVRFSQAFVDSLSWWRVLSLVGLGVAACKVASGIERHSPVHRLALSMVSAVVLLSLFVVEPILIQLSPKRWLASESFTTVLQPQRYDRFYSFGSESYASSFYLKKPFFCATSALPAGSVVFLEQRNLARFAQEIAPHTREVARFVSGVEAEKKALVVVEVLESPQGSPRS